MVQFAQNEDGMKFFKTFSIIIVAIACFTSSANAQLPPETQAKLLDRKIASEIQEGNLSTVENLIGEYKGLGVSVPATYYFIEARIAASRNDHIKAKLSLEQYFQATSTSHAKYDEALTLYEKQSSKVQEQIVIQNAKAAAESRRRVEEAKRAADQKIAEQRAQAAIQAENQQRLLLEQQAENNRTKDFAKVFEEVTLPAHPPKTAFVSTAFSNGKIISTYVGMARIFDNAGNQIRSIEITDKKKKNRFNSGVLSSSTGDYYVIIKETGSRVKLLKVSESGEKTWAKKLGGKSQYSVLMTPIELGDGSIIAGFYSQPSKQTVIFKVSSSGKIIWQKLLGQTGAKGHEFYAYPLSDNGFLVVHKREYNSSHGSDKDNPFLIKKFSSNGDMEWTKLIQNTDYSYKYSDKKIINSISTNEIVVRSQKPNNKGSQFIVFNYEGVEIKSFNIERSRNLFFHKDNIFYLGDYKFEKFDAANTMHYSVDRGRFYNPVVKFDGDAVRVINGDKVLLISNITAK